MLESLIDVLKSKDYKLKEYESLKSYSSLRIGGIARCIVCPDNADELLEVIRLCIKGNVPYKVVGGLTNILFAKEEYPLIFVKTTNTTIKNRAENIFCVESGVGFSSLVSFARQFNFGGMEELSGIPGTVGGAVFGNAGAYGKETADLFFKGEFYLRDKDEIKIMFRDELEFSYRNSILKEGNLILLSACFKLSKSSQSTIDENVSIFRARRLASQPTRCYSLGSIFKRVDGISAGYYIDKAGLKGLRIGEAVVSTKHAGFIINEGNASPDDFLKLIKCIKDRVYEQFGVVLVEEIEIY